MKPEGAMELDPHADLSEHWAGMAINQLDVDLEHVVFPTRATLFVASQNMNVAILIAENRTTDDMEISVAIDFSYEPDEWRIEHWRIVKKPEVVAKTSIIWSPGA